MNGFAYACAVVLAAVFVRAGAAKLARPAQTAAGFRSLGVPMPWWLARVVPAVELALAVGLVAAPRIGGIASLLILGVFTRFLGRALKAGVAAPCNCFGTAHTDPVSIVDVVRNLLLGGLAAAAVATEQPVAPGPLALVTAAVLVAAALLVLRAVRRRVPHPGVGA